MPYWTPQDAHRAQYQRWGSRQPFQRLEARPATWAEVVQRENASRASIRSRGELSPFWNRAINRFVGGHAAVGATAIAQDINQKNESWLAKQMRPDVTGYSGKKRPRLSDIERSRQRIVDAAMDAVSRVKSAEQSVYGVDSRRRKGGGYYDGASVPTGVWRPRGGPGRDSERDGTFRGSGSGSRKIDHKFHYELS